MHMQTRQLESGSQADNHAREQINYVQTWIARLQHHEKIYDKLAEVGCIHVCSLTPANSPFLC